MIKAKDVVNIKDANFLFRAEKVFEDLKEYGYILTEGLKYRIELRLLEYKDSACTFAIDQTVTHILYNDGKLKN